MPAPRRGNVPRPYSQVTPTTNGPIGCSNNTVEGLDSALYQPGNRTIRRAGMPVNRCTGSPDTRSSGTPDVCIPISV